MKKSISLFLAALMLAMIFPVSVISAYADKDKPLLGDINRNGGIDARDYLLLKRAVLHTAELDDTAKVLADINMDGGIDSRDYLLLKRSILGTYVINQPSADEPHNHAYVSETVLPSCDSYGCTEHRCLICDDAYYSDFVNATGHDWKDWEVVTAPTCENAGISTRICRTCGETENQNVAAVGHSYEETILPLIDIDKNGAILSTGDGRIMENLDGLVYKCSVCGDTIAKTSLENISSDKIAEINLNDVSPDGTFFLVTDKNATDAEIKNNIKFMYAQFEGTEHEDKEECRVQYDLYNREDGLWEIVPTEQLEGFMRYLLEIPENTRFRDYTGTRLLFSVEVPETNIIDLSDNIIYLNDIEKSDPGYYPISLNVDENAESYYLKLSKQGVFNDELIGKIVCVGDCNYEENPDQLFSKDILFVKITKILPQENGSAMLTGISPEFEEVFDELYISTDYKPSLDDMIINDEEFEKQAIQAICADDSFSEYLTELHYAAQEYCEKYHFASKSLKNMSYIDKLELKPHTDKEELSNGNFIVHITLDGSLPIPITRSDGMQVLDGTLKMSFSIKYDIEFDIKFEIGTGKEYKLLSKWKEFFDTFKHMSCTVVQTNTFDLTYSIGVSFDYDVSDERYIVNKATGKIHCSECRLAPESGYELRTYSELVDMYGKTRLADYECGLCQPMTQYGNAAYVINNANNMVHMSNCVSAPSSNYYKSDYLPLGSEYSYCENCHPEKTFGTSLKSTLGYEDWNETFGKIKSIVNNGIGSKRSSTEYVPIFNAPVAGIASVVVSIGCEFTFDFNASLSYHKRVKNYMFYGFVLENMNFTPWNNKEDAENIEEFDLEGSIAIRMGVAIQIKLQFFGFTGDHAYVGISVHAGVYANLNGAMHAGLSSNVFETYAAAYFECGLYVTINADYSLWTPNTAVIASKSIPLIKAGYAKAYYGWSDYQPTYNLTKKFGMPLSDLIPTVRYINLTNMVSSTENISLLNNSQYAVKYKFYNTDGTESCDFTVCTDLLKVLKGSSFEYRMFPYISVSNDCPDVTDVILKITVEPKNANPTTLSTFLDSDFDASKIYVNLPDLEINVHYDLDKANPIYDISQIGEFVTRYDNIPNRDRTLNAYELVSVGKQYTISGCGTGFISYDESTVYNASLTDGIASGNYRFKDSNEWFGFYRWPNDTQGINSPDGIGWTIIDLDGVYNVSKIRTHLMNVVEYAIYSPESITVEYSLDGETYFYLCDIGVRDDDVQGNERIIYWTEKAFPAVKARYVRITFSGIDGFVFLNEIEIYANFDEYELVSHDKPYMISGSGTGYINPDENKIYNTPLTDGKASNNYKFSTYNEWFAFFDGDNAPGGIGSVVIDLEGIYNISFIRAHLMNHVPYAITSPDSITIEYSTNGSEYHPIGKLNIRPDSVEGNREIIYWAEKAFDTVKARYIKLTFDIQYCFAFINEVEVYVNTNDYDSVSLGKSYAISGIGKGYADSDKNIIYNASLTDGIAESNYRFSDYNEWFAFYYGFETDNINAPDGVGSVVIDLGNSYVVTLIRTHLMNYVPYAVTSPDSISVEYSLDGVHYYFLGELAVKSDADENNSALIYWADKAVDSVRVQYIRINFDIQYCFAFVNEIEIYQDAYSLLYYS